MHKFADLFTVTDSSGYRVTSAMLCKKKSRFINESSSTLFAQKSSENARTIQLMGASEFAVLRGTESAQLNT